MTRSMLLVALAIAGCREPATETINFPILFMPCDDVDPEDFPLNYDCGGAITFDVTEGDRTLESVCVTIDPDDPLTLSDLAARLAPHVRLPVVPEGSVVSFSLNAYNTPTVTCENRRRAGVEASVHGEATDVELVGPAPEVRIQLECGAPPGHCSFGPRWRKTYDVRSRIFDLGKLTRAAFSDIAATDFGGVVPAGAGLLDRTTKYEYDRETLLVYDGGNQVWVTTNSLDLDLPRPFDCYGTHITTRPGDEGELNPSMLFLSCEGEIHDGIVSTTAYYVGADDLERIFTAIAPNGRVHPPRSGMIIGRVLNADGTSGQSGVTVRPARPDVEMKVRYLDIQDGRLVDTGTDNSGYFVIHERFSQPRGACCSKLIAGAGDLYGESAASVGLVNGTIMTTVIRVGP